MVKKSIKKEELPESKPEVIPFSRWAEEEAQRKGTSVSKVVQEVFKDGFLTYIEESGGVVKLDASQIFKSSSNVGDIPTYIKLRKGFAPVSACVDYIKDTILGSDVAVTMSSEVVKDSFKKDLKEYIELFIEEVYQDEFISGLFEIIDVVLDDALTTGVGASEIIYDTEKPIDFMEFVKNFETVIMKQGDKETSMVMYETAEPNWNDLKGIKRMKIINEAYRRLKLYRDPQSWLSVYWSLDEIAPESTTTQTDVGIQIKALKKTKGIINPVIKLHPWQLFWLSITRKDFSERGESVIAPVCSMALLLDKILNAVGEGIYRAGNKKYFIVCGTPERPWSEPYIRNMVKELKEASEKNWSTIPVPSGFDVKDIGGQIFEATSVVEYFLKVIAKGMKVPNHVVGLPYRAGTEPSYNFQRMRNSVMKAIKRQLILRHIWCKYGKEKQKQGGKGKEILASPELRFKTEGLLNDVDRLKMYVGLLNVANPISPQVKLEVERSICNAMGWDEVDLPSQEGLKKELEEIDKQLKAKLEKKEKSEAPPSLQPSQTPQPPQTEEMLKKRQESGANVRQVGSKKGQSRNIGGTRGMPQIQESVEEEVVEESVPQQKIPIEITVKTESKPQELTIKTESKPQEITIKTESSIRTPLDKIMQKLAEDENELINKQKEREEKLKLLDEEESIKKKEKLQAEINGIEASIEETKKSIEEKNAQIEKSKAETEKAKIESDEIKKTHAKKRKIMEKLEGKLGNDKVVE